MRIAWTRGALRDISRIFRYLHQFNPTAARQVANDLLALGDSLAVFPHRGRPLGDGRRELVSVWPYIVRYKVQGEVVRILRVRHAARRPAGSGTDP